jgi:predicted RNA-binding Zn-ribbon protein involved in translation (DUF1610 family)
VTSLARVRPHPTDPKAVILDIPYELNYAMAKFGPAILAKEHRGYVMLSEHLGSFAAFAKGSDMQVVDERAKPPGKRPVAPECAACGQPAKLDAQPDWCPACGERWVAFYYRDDDMHGGSTKTCDACGHRQTQHFPHCALCGAHMPPDDDTPTRRIVLRRTRLGDPMPLSAVMHEAVADLDDGPTAAEWAELVRLEIRPCKAPDRQRHDCPIPTTDVPLPDMEA